MLLLSEYDEQQVAPVDYFFRAWTRSPSGEWSDASELETVPDVRPYEIQIIPASDRFYVTWQNSSGEPLFAVQAPGEEMTPLELPTDFELTRRALRGQRRGALRLRLRRRRRPGRSLHDLGRLGRAVAAQCRKAHAPQRLHDRGRRSGSRDGGLLAARYAASSPTASRPRRAGQVRMRSTSTAPTRASPSTTPDTSSSPTSCSSRQGS